MPKKKIDYDEWADRFGADDYELPATAQVVEGTPEGHEAMRAMLLEAADTPAEQEVIRNLGGRPTLDPAGEASVPWRGRAPLSLDTEFRALAKQEGRSFSEVLRDAAQEYVAAHGKSA